MVNILLLHLGFEFAEFFIKEYALNLAIAECSKPYISLIDGVAMGGGLGLSVHGQFRVVTEKAVMAMPESRIGFFPDVGGSYFLQKLPHNSGNWLGLTAMAVSGQHCVITGLATHYIHHDKISCLVNLLESEAHATKGETANEHVAKLLATHCTDYRDTKFETQLKQRAAWFDSSDIDTIKTRLADERENEDAAVLLDKLNTGSPHSHTITLALFEETRGASLQHCLETELRLALIACAHPDLAEGVRAVLVDKDHKPQWRY